MSDKRTTIPKKDIKNIDNIQGRVGGKNSSLTLNDNDFIIKHDRLILNKELVFNDFNLSQMNIELSSEMMSRFTEIMVKESLKYDINIFLDRDWNIIPKLPEDEPGRIPPDIKFCLDNPLKCLGPWFDPTRSILLDSFQRQLKDFKFNTKGLKKMENDKVKKDSLTLNDNDFIIKYNKLILTKELDFNDFNVSEINLELSDKMMSRIVQLAIKKSMQSDLGLYLDGNPLPLPFDPIGPIAAFEKISEVSPLVNWLINNKRDKDFKVDVIMSYKRI